MIRRLSLAIVLAFLAALAAHAGPSFQYGACIHAGQNKNALQPTRRSLAVAGMTFRDEVFWHRVEKKKRGLLEYPDNLRDLDELVTSMVELGRRPLLILDYGNEFYDGGELIRSKAGRDAFARYVRFVVRHFLDRVDQFEVWNEWNIGMGSPRRQPGRAEDYVKLLRVAYRAVKSENPTATVIGGAVAGLDDRWIEAFADAGGFEYLDAFSVHPYVYQQPRPIPETAMEGLDRLKARIERWAPGRDLPIYITEVGWPVHHGPLGVSEEVAAAYLQRFLLLARTRPWIAGVWWYDLFDDGDDPRNKEHRFGLLTRDGRARPAYQALLSIRPILESESAPVATRGRRGEITVSGKRKDGKAFIAVWLPTNDFSVRMRWSDAEHVLAAGYQVLDGHDRQTRELRIGATPLILVRD